MALLKLSGLVSSISGKLNGSCFQNTNAGIVLKNLNKKCVKNTQAQNNVQIIISRLQNAWTNFSDSERTAWNQYSYYVKLKQFNNSNRFINGQQTFIKLNYYRLFYGFTILTNPLYYEPYFPNITAEISYESPGNNFIVSQALNASDFFYIIFATKPVQSSLTNAGSLFKLLYCVNNGTTDIDITNSYNSYFGRDIVTDEYCFSKWGIGCVHSGLFSIFRSEIQRVG